MEKEKEKEKGKEENMKRSARVKFPWASTQRVHLCMHNRHYYALFFEVPKNAPNILLQLIRSIHIIKRRNKKHTTAPV